MRRMDNGSQTSEKRVQTAGEELPVTIKRAGTFFFCLILILFSVASALAAEDDMVKFVEAKRIELKKKEESLKREEERLNALRKDVDDKIAAYTRLLAQIESVLNRVEQAKDDKIENVVKAYEVMTAEEAAARLSVLDNATAIQIMMRMKSKKAGAIIAAMAPNKAATLTRSMTVIIPKSHQP